MAELKPCPFACGGKTVPVYDFQNYYNLPFHWKVKCEKCGAEGPTANTKQQAIDAWNKRS